MSSILFAKVMESAFAMPSESRLATEVSVPAGATVPGVPCEFAVAIAKHRITARIKRINTPDVERFFCTIPRAPPASVGGLLIDLDSVDHPHMTCAEYLQCAELILAAPNFIDSGSAM
jgi:hypothetical protein